MKSLVKVWNTECLGDLFLYLIKSITTNLNDDSRIYNFSFDKVFEHFALTIYQIIEEINQEEGLDIIKIRSGILLLSPEVFDFILKAHYNGILTKDVINPGYWLEDYYQKLEHSEQTRILRENIRKMLILINYRHNFSKRVQDILD